jgi:hypothetical protein
MLFFCAYKEFVICFESLPLLKIESNQYDVSIVMVKYQKSKCRSPELFVIATSTILLISSEVQSVRSLIVKVDF